MVGKTLTSMTGPKAIKILDEYFKGDGEVPEAGTKEGIRLGVALSAMHQADKAGVDLSQVVNILCREGADGKPGPVEITYRRN